MNKLKITLNNLLNTPWMIQSSYLDQIALSIFKSVEKNGEIVIEYADDIEYEVVNNKAVIQVEGIFYNKYMVDSNWGFINCNLENTLIAAVDNPIVEEVILKISSPGGINKGITEIADLIQQLSSIKPINTFVNGMAYSASYWIAASCSNIYAYTQSGVGSIGVYTMHTDYSKWLDDMGIKVSFIEAGEYKTTGNAYKALSEKDIVYLQKKVDQLYIDFTSSVAKMRNLKINKKDIWANGKSFETKEALELGLIDEIKSWQEMLGYKKDTFKFIERQNIMAIGETKISDLSVAELQEKNPDLYESIYNTGYKAGQNLGKDVHEECINNLNKENASLKEQLKVYKDKEAKEISDNQIRDFAKTFNLVDEGEQLIQENKSVTEALTELANKASELKAKKQKNFTESAASAVGQGGNEMVDDMPKNSKEAIEYCKNTYNLSKREAWKKARLEFGNLFGEEK